MEPSLPADLAAERAVLGAILLEPEAILAVRWLQPSDFSLERYSWIYEAASACAAERIPPDIVTVSDRLRRHDRLEAIGGITGLGELVESVPTAVYVEHYARIVHAASVRRALIERLGQAAAAAYDQSIAVEEALAASQRIAHEVLVHWASGHELRSQTAPELAAKQLLPVDWIIRELISVGFGYLAAKPGMGKSWLLLQWAIAVAAGGYVFGDIKVAPATVLFFALEDSEQSLAERLRILTKLYGTMPERLHLYHMESGPNGTPPLRRIDEGGLLQLEHELQRHEGVKLIILDTLTCLAPMVKGRGNPYLEDYTAYLPLRDFAQRHGIALLGSWHYNKAGSPDPMELLSGSMGLPAIAINRIGIVRERGEAEATLHSFSKRGREIEWRLRFDAETCQWLRLGDAQIVKLSEEREAILSLLEENGAARPRDVARLLDQPYPNVIQLLRRMLKDGQVVKDEAGRYGLPETEKQ